MFGLTSLPSACAAAVIDPMGSDVLGARLDLRLEAATGAALGSRLAARLDRRLADRGTEVVLPDRPLLLICLLYTSDAADE